MNVLNLDNATAEDLDNISMEQLLGQNISDVNLSSSIPDGTYLGLIEKFEKKVFSAKPEQGKAASIALNITFHVHSALHLADPNIDPKSVAGRKHFQSFFVTNENGLANLAKLLLGIIGVKFNDKEAILEVGQSILALLEELKANNVYFGFTVKNVERNGYENCDIVFKQDKFIAMEAAQELVANAA